MSKGAFSGILHTHKLSRRKDNTAQRPISTFAAFLTVFVPALLSLWLIKIKKRGYVSCDFAYARSMRSTAVQLPTV